MHFNYLFIFTEIVKFVLKLGKYLMMTTLFKVLHFAKIVRLNVKDFTKYVQTKYVQNMCDIFNTVSINFESNIFSFVGVKRNESIRTTDFQELGNKKKIFSSSPLNFPYWINNWLR